MKFRPSHPPSRWPALLAACALALPVPAVAAPKAAGAGAGFYEDALVRYERQDYAGAILQLKNSLQQDKDQIAVQLLLGKALLANSEVSAAEIALGEALRLGVDRAEVVVPLAQSLVSQGKHRSLAIDPRLSVEGLPAQIRFTLLLVKAAAQGDLGQPREAGY